MASWRDTLTLSLMGLCLTGSVVAVQFLGGARKAAKRPGETSIEERIKQLKL